MNAQETWKAAYKHWKGNANDNDYLVMIGYRREAALERRIAALERENATSSEIIEDAYVVLGNGDFKNGVTDPSGYIDEGEVYAGDQFDRMRQWLLVHPAEQNYIKSEMRR